MHRQAERVLPAALPPPASLPRLPLHLLPGLGRLTPQHPFGRWVTLGRKAGPERPCVFSRSLLPWLPPGLGIAPCWACLPPPPGRARPPGTQACPVLCLTASGSRPRAHPGWAATARRAPLEWEGLRDVGGCPCSQGTPAGPWLF
uniref:Uncharacterized protein n=1 Tax=Pipistrellus kuhlii TaxID=59472 RepID=A0A7J7WDB0_PIPKU|nr:hypothetical protein mPipKuh1_008095 [Pipistrellus kuhlii]